MQQSPESSADAWQRVHRLIAAGQPMAAQTELLHIVARDPGDTRAHLFLCGLHCNADQQRLAASEALRAAETAPSDPEMLGDVVAALLWVGEIVAARQLLDSPVFSNSRSAQVLMRAAGQRQAIGEHATALALMERARAAGANGREFMFHYAVQLAFNGQMDSARAKLERCIELDPPLGRACVQLARMRTATPEANLLARIAEGLRQGGADGVDHAALHFARFEELHSLSRHSEAWEALARGNALMHALLPFDPAREAAMLLRVEQCTADWLRTTPVEPVSDDPQPIFIVGMPRSGTTLLERILGNHSQVTAAGELGDFPRALALATDHLAAQLLDDTTLARLPDVDWHALGCAYLDETRWRAEGRRFYIDKLPRNWMLAGLIRRALPQAKILHLVRDPMGTCFSNWRALFGPGAEYAYSYDLGGLTEYFRAYRRLMEYWHRAMPGQIVDVDYARLVQEPASTAREMLASCGLAWEPGCIELSRNSAPSATLSMAQVRASISPSTSTAWRPYAAQLSALQRSLERATPVAPMRH
jgi:tetratricopeptide (TPR) repeat protein